MQTIRIENGTIIRVLVSFALFLLAVRVAIIIYPQLLWIAAAFFLAVALNPAVQFFTRFMPKKSRALSILLVLVIFFAILGLLIFSFAPPLINQTNQLIHNAPKALDQLQNDNGVLGQLVREYDITVQINKFSDQALQYVGSASGSAFDILTGVFSGIAAAATIFALTFFMSLEGPRWIKLLWQVHPKESLKRNQELLKQMYRAVTGYVDGNFITSAVAAVTSMIVMSLLGVPYAIPLGILVGILDLIPLVGATVAAVIVCIVALFVSVWATVILAVFFIIYQQVENNVLQPLVYGKSTELSPLVVTVAIIIGAALAGIFGALVAIPVAACVKVLLAHRFREQLKAS